MFENHNKCEDMDIKIVLHKSPSKNRLYVEFTAC